MAHETRAGDGAGVEPYLGSRIEQRLAEDPRTAELGIHIRVAGARVFVSGEVACADRRARVVEVVHELAPSCRSSTT
jgi:hypothetical protein